MLSETSGKSFWEFLLISQFFAKTLSVEKYLSSLYTMVEELLSLRLFVFVVEVAL